MKQSVLQLSVAQGNQTFVWEGAPRDVYQTEAEVRRLLQSLQTPLYVLNINGNVVLEERGRLAAVDDDGIGCLGMINSLAPMNLGNATFCQAYNTRYPYYAGAMANGINSVAMVIALGQAGILSSFGAGGLSAQRVADAIDELNQALPEKRYAINLLHNPGHPTWEMECVEHCLNKGVKLVEASAYINLSAALVYYRVAGLRQLEDGRVVSDNKIIAKVSRAEVAKNFLMPPPEKLISKLAKAGLVTEQQMALAKSVPMADDITVESDSGGHTDHGVLSCIFPEIVALRNQITSQQNYPEAPRVGAAGGIGSPEGAWAAFAMGADYIVTGSINQACEESGTSETARELLKAATVTDVVSAPSADMFELGAKVQVLKANSMYGVRAQKLYSLYKQYESMEALPEKETSVLEKTVFGQPLAAVWADTKAFFESRNMQDIVAKAEANAKKKMALVFQWYLGQSSKWAIEGNDERKVDYQIWCGPAMGTCNQWLQGSSMEKTRSVVAIAENIMFGAAYLARVAVLKNLGVIVPPALAASPVLSVSKIKELVGSLQYSFGPTPASEHHGNPTQPLEGNTAMSTVTEATTKLNLKESKAYYKKTWDLLPGGAHYNFADPERPLVIPFNKGRGSRVWDLDGNEHLDLFAKFGAMFVGHNNPDYMTALRKYMDKVTSVDTCDLEYEVCSTLSRHIPCAEMVRFALSGTEAVQNALRLARAYTGKNRFVRFQGHYHGNADNVMGGRKPQDRPGLYQKCTVAI